MKRINVRDFGALGDGVTLDTDAIQNAINAAQSGDCIVFSSGIFVTGTLELKSNLTLCIEEGAELCGSRNIAHYRACGFYHNEMIKTVSLLYALHCENITLEGSGMLQLSGDAFMDFGKLCIPDEIDPASMLPEYAEQTVVAKRERPTQPIFFHDCKNIRVRDLRIFNSPCWTLVFSACDGVAVEGIYMDNHRRIPNNDGIHCSASRNITVQSCTFLCGDDCFAATDITDWNGVCENIKISDCLMSSRSAAIRLGHLCSHVRNVEIQNIKVVNSNRAIILFAADGGCIKNVTVENMVAETQIYAGFWWGKGEGFVLCTENSSGTISDVTFRNCRFTEENPAVVSGEVDSICNLTLEHCAFVYRPGNTHPYYYEKMELEPNVQGLQPAPFVKGDTLYIKEGCCKNLQIKNET